MCKAYKLGGGPSLLTSVGAILLFLGIAVCSSFSDSLASLLPRMLPLTELVVLIVPDIGVCGGVVQDRLTDAELVAATLGTFPKVGVGLVVTNPTPDVAIEELELDRVGLGGRATAIEEIRGTSVDAGVGSGVICADDEAEMAGDG